MAEALVRRRAALAPMADHPRLAGGPHVVVDGITVGEWSLTRSAWTDLHQHVEVNTVLEGELVVTVDGVATTLGPGDTIAVPAGSVGRYEAPVYARMHYVYGPGTPGMTETAYEEL